MLLFLYYTFQIIALIGICIVVYNVKKLSKSLIRVHDFESRLLIVELELESIKISSKEKGK